MKDKKIVLASGSPRRVELLRLLAREFEVLASDADETLAPGTAPDEAVRDLAARKARAVALLRPKARVIGADTVVSCEGFILGKPRDRADAERMLRLLSGREHQVYTGVAVCEDGRCRTAACRTDVRFANITEEELVWYLDTKEPADKAGAYGIQGYGARFVLGIRGDFFNVMGLPVRTLYEMLGTTDK